MLYARFPLVDIAKVAGLTAPFCTTWSHAAALSRERRRAPPTTGDTSSWFVSHTSSTHSRGQRPRSFSHILQLAFCVMMYTKSERKTTDRFLIGFLSRARSVFYARDRFACGGSVSHDGADADAMFPVFAPLFFFWFLARAYQKSVFTPPITAMAIVAFACVLLWQSPIATANDQLRADDRVVAERLTTTLRIAFKWIGANTANGTVAIAPPWRQDYWWQTRRSGRS